jgi:hypothetical protein
MFTPLPQKVVPPTRIGPDATQMPPTVTAVLFFTWHVCSIGVQALTYHAPP